MSSETKIGIGALLALAVYWFAIRKDKAAAQSPIRIGKLESTVTTQASVEDILGLARGQSIAAEDPVISQLRTDIASQGAVITSCSDTGTYGVWCTLSNGWRFPQWLLVDYLQLPYSNA
jgi:hypothetical protein